MDIKGDINSKTVTVGDFNTPLISMDRLLRQKINKKMVGLNDTLEQMDSVDIFLQSISTQSSKIHILSNAHGTFVRIYHMLGHKPSLNKFKKIVIIQASSLTVMV